jgi:hypothetical protein
LKSQRCVADETSQLTAWLHIFWPFVSHVFEPQLAIARALGAGTISDNLGLCRVRKGRFDSWFASAQDALLKNRPLMSLLALRR